MTKRSAIYRFRILLTVVVLPSCLFSAKSSHAANLLVNGDFTASLSGWSVLNTVFDTGEAAVLSDGVSERVAVFQGVELLGLTSIDVQFDFLNGLSTVVPAGGLPDSMFATVYTGSSPFGTDFDAGAFDGAVSLLDLDGAAVSSLLGGATISPSSAKGAGWSFFSGSFVASDPHAAIAFEFVNDNTVLGDSTAAVDNVVLSTGAIPEPSVVGLLTFGFGLALRRRRRVS